MNKENYKLSEYEIDNISNQLAEFFYSFFTNPKNNKLNLNKEVTVLKSGSVEGFPEKLKQ